MRSSLLAALLSVTAPYFAPAQDGHFASGKNKSLTLSKSGDVTSVVEFVVRSIEHDVRYYSGEIKTGKRVNTFETSALVGDGAPLKFQVTVRLAGDTITIIADFPDSLPAESDPSGTYTRLSDRQHLAFVKSGYGEADKALNARWAELKKSLPAGVMADLQERQRGWIEHKEYMSGWGAGDDVKSSPSYWSSAWDMTIGRLHFLDIYLGDGVPGGIAGAYIDGYGGLVNIVEAGGGTHRFQINVVRGPTYHTGVITKSVTIRGGKGRFVDTDKEAFWDGKPCTINFVFSGNRLELKCENTAAYHGVRAFFDGTYFKTKAKPVIDEEEG